MLHRFKILVRILSLEFNLCHINHLFNAGSIGRRNMTGKTYRYTAVASENANEGSCDTPLLLALYHITQITFAYFG